jgi:hypothetical protein
MKISFFLLILSGLFCSCGKNNGTPKPPSSNDNPSGDGLAPTQGENLQLSGGEQWRAGLEWSRKPQFSDEVFLEMTGKVYFRLKNGQIPQDIKDVKFSADMPEHNHGTGNILPVIQPSSNGAGEYQFKNLFFTMAGQWRIRVSGQVDGQRDVWTLFVQVTE